MNRIKWLMLTGLIVSLLSGCGTTSGRIIMASTVTVDHAMQAWAVYVVDGHATTEQQSQVRSLKLRYDRAEDLAVEAYIMLNRVGDKEGWKKAKEALLAERNALINLIEQLTGSNL